MTAGLAALLVVGALLAAGPARAFVPRGEKILDAAAETNEAAGRSVALELEVVLWLEDPTAPGEVGEEVAVGELLSDPRGYARLELRGAREVRERHVLHGARLAASRDGRRIENPRAYLPPVAVLQAVEPTILLDALYALGIAVDQAELGRSHGHDCYVVGGRARAFGQTELAPLPRAALWVDIQSYEIVRIDRADGTIFRFGPSRAFGRVILPAWFSVRAPGAPPIRLEVRDATRAEPGPDDFSGAWLLEP